MKWDKKGISCHKNNQGLINSDYIYHNHRPHLYAKWGLDIQSMTTSRLWVIF